jgi:hypothetical protein
MHDSGFVSSLILVLILLVLIPVVGAMPFGMYGGTSVGDMEASTYDPASKEEQILTVSDITPTVGNPGSDAIVPSEQAVREALAINDGSTYTNFGDASDDTIDELYEAIDDAMDTGGGQNGMIRIARIVTLADGGYYDLPVGAQGVITVMVGDAEAQGHLSFASDGTVKLFAISGKIVSTNKPGKFCVYDNGTHVRMLNNTGATKDILLDILYQ